MLFYYLISRLNNSGFATKTERQEEFLIADYADYAEENKKIEDRIAFGETIFIFF